LQSYIGRFAPSPTGPLHAGSLVAALASWLDARAHQGVWLVRIEDVDTPRCMEGGGELVLHQLAIFGLRPDAPPVYQSARSVQYQQALDTLAQRGWAYACACSRKDIETAYAARGQQRLRNSEMVYPGTCRTGLQGRPARAWRIRTDIHTKNMPSLQIAPAPEATNNIAHHILHWHDRCLGAQQQNLACEVGDFILRRADGLWAYQLAVVVDDAAQGISHVVRGQDLADNTPRQIHLQQALGLPTPQYLHTPLVYGLNGEKLSKQNGAQALDTTAPLATLQAAAQSLGLPAAGSNCTDALAAWVEGWRALYNPAL